MTRFAAPLHYSLSWLQKARTGANYAASFHGKGRFSVFTHRPLWRNVYWRLAKIAACVARFCSPFLGKDVLSFRCFKPTGGNCLLRQATHSRRRQRHFSRNLVALGHTILNQLAKVTQPLSGVIQSLSGARILTRQELCSAAVAFAFLNRAPVPTMSRLPRQGISPRPKAACGRTYLNNPFSGRRGRQSHLFAAPSPRSSLLRRQPRPVKRNRSLIPSRSITNTRGLVKNAYFTSDQSIPLTPR